MLALLKRRDRWVRGTYLASIEWWTGNLLLHVVMLASGQLALLPHHKLKFGADQPAGFEPYRKVRRAWRAAR